MALCQKPYTFSIGTVIVASEHNSDFDILYNCLNGNLTNANIKASAGIVDTKLATISTSSKVNLSALIATSQATGDIIYKGASGYARLPIGTTGQKLKVFSPYLNTGGTITTDGLYTVHTFLSSGTFVAGKSGDVRVLVVAGGGGGGWKSVGGGGGGGGLVYHSAKAVASGNYGVTVGGGGAGGTTGDGVSGDNSIFDVSGTPITALGGGGGGCDPAGAARAGVAGGSGGGSSRGGSYSAATQGDSGGGTGYGNASGNSSNSAPSYGASGGGGAGSVATDGTASTGGNGGSGRNIADINASYYAGGGGGASNDDNYGGASHGGGHGAGAASPVQAVAGTSNTGGGGGGGAGAACVGAAGGSGIVIVKCLTSDFLSSSTVPLVWVTP